MGNLSFSQSSLFSNIIDSLSIVDYALIFLIIIVSITLFLFIRSRKIKTKDLIQKKLIIIARNVLKIGILIIDVVLVAHIMNLELNSIFSTPILLFDNKSLFSIYDLLFITAFIFLYFAFVNVLKVALRKMQVVWSIDQKLIVSVEHFLTFFFILVGVALLTRFSTGILTELFSFSLFSIGNTSISPGILMYAFAILYALNEFIRISEFFYHRKILSKGLDAGRSRTIFQIVKYLVWVIASVLFLDSIGISINMLIAGSAALFVGLGFGMQALFNDFVSGLIILFEGTLQIGDIVEIQDGTVGRVKEVGLRTSKILTRANIILIVPNHKFVSDDVINWSYSEPRTRFSVDVGVAYGSDVRLVEKLLTEVANGHSEIVRKPVPFVYFTDFADSSLNFRLFFWVEESFMVEKIKSDLRFAIDDSFRKNNVEIPFPQRDIHIKEPK